MGMTYNELISVASSLAKDEEHSVEITNKVVCNWEISDFIHSSRFNRQSFSHISNESNSREKVTEIMSPTFYHSGSSEWRVQLSHQSSEFLLCFHLLSSQCDPSFKAEVKASLLNQHNMTVDVVYPTETVRLSAPQTSAKKRIRPFNGYTHYGYSQNSCDYSGRLFMLVCEVSVAAEAAGGSAPLRGPASAPGDLASSLGALLESGDLADLVLCAGGREFRAHKALLSARSPVFAAMLRHDSREAQTGRADIPDVDPDTLAELLRYVYTGSAPQLKARAGKLLVAADKYDLRALKQLCEAQLASGLTVDNAAATAAIALSHSCDLLTRAAVDFIKNHLAQVVGTSGWAHAITHHTQTVVELSRLVADKTTN